uniref:Beta-amylase n=1 Tax=Arcella intermedia TaxID=1963864 RepID=A0A6B2L506_9EUKA
MLPLNTITNDGNLNNNLPFDSWFAQLRSANVDGVMGDVWWGIVEKSGPKQYNWSPYQQLLQKVQSHGLKMQATMSFHQCGGNVGDDCDIPLPPWVTSVGNSNPDIYYTDREGNRDHEYLSLGVDNQTIFQGRSPVQIYTDFVRSFASTFSSLMGSTIVELQVGLGPAGELRYPSYQLSRWSFPGVGEFQCYDKYMLADLSRAASAAGHPEWGNGGPNNAGSYNCNPCNDGSCGPFFGSGFDNYNSAYGQFFLGWYSDRLLEHAVAILSNTVPIAKNYGVEVSTKISGIHWQFNTPAHGAELTAGYRNSDGNAYNRIAQTLSRFGVVFDFTCLEMRDSEQPGGSCCCSPENLVYQTLVAAKNNGIVYKGENALPRYDQTAYNTIKYESNRVGPIGGFTYLRLGDTLMQSNNFQTFSSFVNQMHNL